MRSLLPLAAVLLIAGCDSNNTDADFIGSWTLAEARSETVVQSQTNQPLLVLSQPGAGSVSITGDQTHTLTRVNYQAEPSIGQILSLRPAADLPGAFQFTSLVLGRSTNDSGVTRAQATFEGIVADGSRTRTYRADLGADTSPFVRDGDRLVVPSVTMSDGEGRTVTAGGAISFPTIQARAGQEVAVPGDATALPTQGSIRFDADGRVTLVYESESIRDERGGTWTEIAPGLLSLDVGGEPLMFDVQVAGSRLRLSESTPVPQSCATEPDCLSRVEDEILADRGSLASARRVTSYIYR